MPSDFTLACANCVYNSMRLRFPPTVSWVVLMPVWFLMLSVVRTTYGVKLAGIPHIVLAIPIVLAVFVFGAMSAGPVLGLWIPVCCVVGTLVGIYWYGTRPVVKVLKGLTAVMVIALVGFGARDYYEFGQLTDEERERLVPVWEVRRDGQRRVGPPAENAPAENAPTENAPAENAPTENAPVKNEGVENEGAWNAATENAATENRDEP